MNETVENVHDGGLKSFFLDSLFFLHLPCAECAQKLER